MARHRLILAWLVAGGAILALPSLGAANDERRVAVHSIDTISVAGPPRIVDITGTGASLVFESNLPLACSVVYGDSEAFGQVAIDQDMDGGAHNDHHPLLVGLKPGTQYFYRVQGTAADGTLFMSEVRTFRTPAADALAAVNLVSPAGGGRIVAVSSNYGGANNDDRWGADSAVDGRRDTAWSSNGDGDDAFIEVALAAETRIGAIEVWTRTMSNGTAQTFAFTLTTEHGEVHGPFRLADASRAYRFDVDIVAGRLRLDVVESSGGNTGLVEYAVFAAPK
jgi:hypothetical protein